MTEQDWRLAPAGAAAWLGAWLGTSGWRPGPGTALLLLGVLTVAGLVVARRWWRTMLVVLAVTALLAGAREWALRSGPVAELAATGAHVTCRVVVDGDPTRPPGRGDGLTLQRARLVVVTTATQRFTGEIPATLVAARDQGERMAALPPGGVVEVAGVLRPEDPGSPMAVVLAVRRVGDVIREPGPWDRTVTAIREGLLRASASLPPDQAGLVPSLVLGDRSAVTPEVQAQFQATSLTHLMAVSGANLTLLLGVLMAASRWLGVRSWGIRVVAAIGVLAFVLVCRAEPSVLRAAAMGLIALPAIGISRGRRSLRGLALAVLLLTGIDPWLSRSWGFALSVSACLGIVSVGGTIVSRLSRWCPDWVAEAVAIPLAAQLATLPLTAELSGRVSVSGVVANVMAGPFVGPATVLGLAAALLVWWPAAAALVAGLAGLAVQPILAVAAMVSTWPSASLPWPRGPAGILSSLILLLLCLWLAPRVVDHPRVALLLAGVLVVVNFIPRLPPGPWTVVFCDVGQGDATVVRAGPTEAVLVDTGPEPALVLECLEDLGVRAIPMVVFTHFHQDHIGGAEEVLRRYRPAVVVVSPLRSPARAAAEVVAAAEAAGAQVVTGEPGLRYRIGAVSWLAVSAWLPTASDAEGDGESVVENDSSVVSIVEVGGVRVLLPGDIELDGQAVARRELERLGIDPHVSVYKLPHHGAAKQDLQLLAGTGASLAVVSAGRGNRYGHPAERTIRAAEEAGMTLARTDLQGHLLVSASATGVRVTPWEP
ncbi:ComEC/Rec2 family competence protein [Arachnia propionica]|uniref:ComEC/Rec2 family competence protein n=1 Tax=Arachnia propionica TaxID=1750 RepID=A0A3P1WV04_9ACTN|nr:ComEC/Rec2 family competence protein [Arachnia propionica]RRD50422.1 ComEC/Rec2 family competence protein [Arachnia propionica]